MSQKDVELIRRAFVALNDGFQRGDLLPYLREFCDPQIVYNPAGLFPETAVEMAADTVELHGHEGLLRFATMQAEAFEEFGLEPREYIDAADRVVVPLRFGGRARHTGLDVFFEIVYVVTARDGKLTRVDAYVNKAEALEAVGLEG